MSSGSTDTAAPLLTSNNGNTVIAVREATEPIPMITARLLDDLQLCKVQTATVEPWIFPSTTVTQASIHGSSTAVNMLDVVLPGMRAPPSANRMEEYFTVTGYQVSMT